MSQACRHGVTTSCWGENTTLCRTCVTEHNEFVEHIHKEQLEAVKKENEKLKELLCGLQKAEGLGASHPQFSRYFYISEELGEKIRQALEEQE